MELVLNEYHTRFQLIYHLNAVISFLVTQLKNKKLILYISVDLNMLFTTKATLPKLILSNELIYSVVSSSYLENIFRLTCS